MQYLTIRGMYWKPRLPQIFPGIALLVCVFFGVLGSASARHRSHASAGAPGVPAAETRALAGPLATGTTEAAGGGDVLGVDAFWPAHEIKSAAAKRHAANRADETSISSFLRPRRRAA